MNRKNFIKNSLLGSASVIAGSKGLKARNVKLKKSTLDEMIQDTEQVGFNHLPNDEIRTMKTVLHKANTRGHANHGWLDSNHSFSFANYRNPERMNFGVLRVLNDDVVSSGRGFGTHPHDNMEIISIPLEGALEHKDNMGNTALIKAGDIQVMSAGTGVYHSEYNRNENQDVKFLQIWLFPNKRDVQPRYDQITLEQKNLKNQFHQILSPSQDDEGVWIHQNAWFLMGNFETNQELCYNLKDSKNGVYAFILEGKCSIEGQSLEKRDGFGLWETQQINITAEANSSILLMEVPMQF